MSDEYAVRINYTGEFPWPWDVWVEPPGYPHAGVNADNALAFTRRGAERAANRIVRRMELARRRKLNKEYKVTPREVGL